MSATTGPNWLSDDEMAAWTAFLAAGALVGRRVEQQLREDAGLSHLQYEILVRLAAAPDGALRMTELADALICADSNRCTRAVIPGWLSLNALN